MAGDITPRQVVSVVGVCSATLTYGLMMGWSATLPRLQDEDNLHFNLTDQDVANLVSMPSFIGLASSLASGPLVEYIGPRLLLQSSLVPIIGLWLMMAFTPYKELLYVGRAGVAICVYLQEAITNPLLAELTPAASRGTGGSGVVIASSVGTLIGFILAHFTTYVVATASRVIIPVMAIILICFVPESPYWLLRRGRVQAAKKSLRQLLGNDEATDKELSAMMTSPSSTQSSIKDQFVALRKNQNLHPVLLVLALFVLRDLGGRSAIIQYSVYIFRQADVTLDAFTCTVILGVIRLVFSVASIFTLDRLGRRPLLMGSAGACSLAQGIAGICLLLEVPGTSWLPLVTILVYVASYGIGLGPVMWVYLGEVLPSPVRSVAVSIITVAYSLSVFAENIAFLNLLSFIGLGTILILMAILNVLIIPLIWKLMPESAGVTLQQLEMSFINNTSDQTKPNTLNYGATIREKSSAPLLMCTTQTASVR